jgi:hypothetical protein
MINKPLYFAYFTKNTLYEKEARRLQASLVKYNLNYELLPIENQGSWQKNISMKASLIQQKLLSTPTPLVYVDCDAEFVAYPTLFDNLTCDIALHEFDRSLYNTRIRAYRKEILSGTLFFNQTDKAKFILQQWVELSKSNPNIWDQKLLAQVIGRDFYRLPASYCCIFDTMKDVKDKVIIHYQASRKMKRLERKGP